jgi:hypothetical protein
MNVVLYRCWLLQGLQCNSRKWTSLKQHECLLKALLDTHMLTESVGLVCHDLISLQQRVQ